MDFCQIMILILGAGAVWLVSQKKSYKKYGYILGLLGQPFWLYTTITNKQLGMFILTLFYIYSWSLGVYNYFIKKEKDV